MRRLAAGAFVVGILATFATGVAQATPTDGPSGFLCGFTSTTDPGTEDGSVQTGEIDGGPLVVTDAAGNPASGTLKCTIQVGGSTHADADNGASASASGNGVVTLPPTLVSYVSPPNVPVYLCSQFTFDGGGTVYFDDPNDPTVDGSWDTDPTVDCGLATSEDSADFLCVAVDGCDGGGGVLCVVVTGCNNNAATICVAVVSGCNGGTHEICVAPFGCGPVPALAPDVTSAKAPDQARASATVRTAVSRLGT